MGIASRLHVEGRVLSSAFSLSKLLPSLRRLWALAYRLETDEVPELRVEARCGDVRASAISDEEGYFAIELEVTKTLLVPPLLALTLETEDAETVEVQARVPGPRARHAIISDVDDTLLVSHATSRWKHAYHAFFSDAQERREVEGMSELLCALERGIHSDEQNPVAYVSSSPTNVGAVTQQALRRLDFPEGPMFLKDFGLDETKFWKTGHVEHKVARIERILDAWPHLSAILIGDTGQSDPDVFREIAKRHRSRLSGVLLHDAPGGSAERADAAIREIGADFGVIGWRFSHLREIERALIDLGWIRGADRQHLRATINA